jgi:hypothetical protein
MALTKISYSMVTGAPLNVLDYGADPTGASDSRAACQAAINAAKAIGTSVYFPAGSYLIRSTTGPDSKDNGLVVPYTNPNDTANRVKLIGDGASTILKAGDNNMIVVRWSDSHCSMQGFSIDGNSKTDVWALGVVPQDMTQTTSLTFQTYNEFTDLYILGCAEGIAMRCGPDVGGADSGCWYNSFINVFIYYCTRGIWMMDCPVGSSGTNRNYFTNMRIGQFTNTGVQIDDGGTNVFMQLHIEGVNTGTSPNTTPTAVKIKQTGASGADNNTNTFFGCMFEANTRSLENANAYSEFYGCAFGAPYTMLLTQNPKVLIGDDASICPQFAPGYVFQTNGQLPGISNQALYLQFGRIEFPASPNPTTDPNVLDDYEEGTWTPTLAASSMAGQTYAFQRGRYVKIGRTVAIWGEVQLSGYSNSGTNYLRMAGLPFASDATAGAATAPIALIYAALTGGTTGRLPRGVIGTGQTECSFIEQDADGQPVATFMQGTRLTTSSSFSISGVYQTAS